MSHLGSLLSALADGQLPPHEAERVLGHVAGCAECADALESVRSARRRLADAHDVPSRPDLAGRLLALGATTSDPAPARPPQRWSDAAGFADSVPLPGERGAARSALPAGCLRGELPRSRWALRSLTVVGCAGALVVGLAALGERPTVAPTTHQAYALTVLARAVPSADGGTGSRERAEPVRAPGAAAQASLTLPAGEDHPGRLVLAEGTTEPEVVAWLSAAGWASPAGLPAGYTVTAVRLDVDGTGGLEVDLEGPHGTVVVLQEQGRLDPSVVDRLPTHDLDGRRVHVLSRAPWHVAWQAGDVAVSVVGEGSPTAVLDVVRAFPAEEFDDGVPARIARGWSAVAGAWTP